MSEWVVCPWCAGRGGNDRPSPDGKSIVFEPCTQCAGTGKIS